MHCAMTGESIAPIRTFAADLVGTLVGNPESMQQFRKTWEQWSRSDDSATRWEAC